MNKAFICFSVLYINNEYRKEMGCIRYSLYLSLTIESSEYEDLSPDMKVFSKITYKIRS